MNRIHPTYSELQRQMHVALRAQNPHWVGPNGESPICDDYERCLATLLGLVAKNENTPVYLNRDDSVLL